MSQHEDLSAPPKVWHHNLAKKRAASYSQVKRRLLTLEEATLVERDEDKEDYYIISDLGVRYVQGKIERDRLEQLEPDD